MNEFLCTFLRYKFDKLNRSKLDISQIAKCWHISLRLYAEEFSERRITNFRFTAVLL